jgi:hypothetical protein
MELKDSLQGSQEPANGDSPEPNESCLLKIHFNIATWCLGLPSGLFPSGLPTGTSYPYIAHRIFHDFIIIIIFDERIVTIPVNVGDLSPFLWFCIKYSLETWLHWRHMSVRIRTHNWQERSVPLLIFRIGTVSDDIDHQAGIRSCDRHALGAPLCARCWSVMATTHLGRPQAAGTCNLIARPIIM